MTGDDSSTMSAQSNQHNQKQHRVPLKSRFKIASPTGRFISCPEKGVKAPEETEDVTQNNLRLPLGCCLSAPKQRKLEGRRR